jgi:hypothetical protein
VQAIIIGIGLIVIMLHEINSKTTTTGFCEGNHEEMKGTY